MILLEQKLTKADYGTGTNGLTGFWQETFKIKTSLKTIFLTITFPFLSILIWGDGPSHLRGNHENINIWVPMIGDDSLVCRRENENENDPHAVAILWGNNIVGHVPQNISDFFLRFLMLPRTSICPQISGSRVNRDAGYGLEVPVDSYKISCMAKEKDVDKAVKSDLKGPWKIPFRIIGGLL